ncbi:hypothetical protein ABFT23_06360 [Nocardioides sp. C4-1]|uniref:hypothetical protein n=1 Tax=Nocardioides sp. C4-1 TaxID=3151851 RepID=UPI003266CE64
MRVLIALGVFAAGMVALVVGFVVLNLVIWNDEPLDCDTVTLPEPGEWQALDLGDKYTVSTDLGACGRLDGLTSSEVTELFGTPDGDEYESDGTRVLIYVFDPDDDPGDADELRFFVDDDRVSETEVVTSSG